MRCLLVADLHYSLKQFDWLLTEASGFDVVILAGDLLEIGSMVPLDAQIVVVKGYLEKLSAQTKLIVCSGNHDLESVDPNGERHAKWVGKLTEDGIAVDGERLDIGETRITICPWWDGPDCKTRIAAQLASDSEDRPKRWVWVYHAPPSESPVSWAGSRHFGDAALDDWIDQYQPDLVLSGHVHQSPFVEGGSWADRRGKSWVFNAGKQIGDFPTHVIFDLDRQAAAWFSFERGEEVALDQPLSRPIPHLSALPDWIGPAA